MLRENAKPHQPEFKDKLDRKMDGKKVIRHGKSSKVVDKRQDRWAKDGKRDSGFLVDRPKPKNFVAKSKE